MQCATVRINSQLTCLGEGERARGVETMRGNPEWGNEVRVGGAVGMEFSRDIPVRHSVDVFVAGGGPSGVAAALAATRQGSRVYLAESHTCFGGMGTAGLVPAFMQFSDGLNFLAGGIGRDIYDSLIAAGGKGPDDDDNPILCVSIRAEVLKRVYDEMIGECGAEFTFQTQVIGVEKNADGRITHAVCAAKSGLFAVAAKVFVDCTGDGDLAVLAGAGYEKGDPEGAMMPGTLCSLWADIDWDAVRADGRWPQAVIQQAIDEGRFPVPDRHLPGMYRVGTHIGGGNIGHTFGVDGTDERSLTQAFVYGRRLALDYQKFFSENLGGYADMDLVATGSLMGIRESRRIMGDYVLCLDDFKRRARFDDEIGRYSYPVDIHASTPDADRFAAFEKEFESFRYDLGESYGIPYRSLIARGLDNVLVAGRCISSDRYIQGSVRVMPGCFITGQAAGVAAAMASGGTDGEVRAISVTELQRRLLAIGGFLPNAGA